MKVLIIILSVILLQELPYKAKEEFDVKLDYQFKQRPASDPATVHLGETKGEFERRSSTAMLPYLMLKINILKLNEGNRIRITNNRNNTVVNKKVEEGTTILLDIGFTDDAKDRVTPNEYTITFLSPEKKGVSRIVINIDEDGTFYVNSEKRGRF